MSVTRIYLDNAATTWPKPETVSQAVAEYLRTNGAPYGRGAYESAGETQKLVQQCRQRAARLLGVTDPQRVIFTFNATDSLNLAIHGLLRAGDHVITSGLEHNSVSRPLKHLEQAGIISVTRLLPEDGAVISVEQIERACNASTRLICLQHASNVTGTIQPIVQVARFARAQEIRFLVDAAQTAGAIPIEFDNDKIDLLACAGHKGLLGPLGTGLLCLTSGIEAELSPVRQGGTGTQSELELQPETLPDRYEAGNHNVPGLVGLNAGLEFLLIEGIDAIREREQSLFQQLLEGLRQNSALTIHGVDSVTERLGLVSLTSETFDPQTLAMLLAQEFGIETRAGLHCAPGIHKWLGTFASGGTVRISLGPFNTPEHIESLLAALDALHV